MVHLLRGWPARAAAVSRRGGARTAAPAQHVAQVRLAMDVLASIHFFSSAEIKVDFAREELQSLPRLDGLCAFLNTVGRRLGKPVVVTPENCPDRPLIGYDVAADRSSCSAELARAAGGARASAPSRSRPQTQKTVAAHDRTSQQHEREPPPCIAVPPHPKPPPAAQPRQRPLHPPAVAPEPSR
jgi:hypothetical protein